MTRCVGVMGGSFDPVHDGHVALARRALEQLPCDEVWFMPAGLAVHKPAGPAAGAVHRRAMLELAIARDRAFRLCTVELESAAPMRSVESLRQLSATWPDHRWYFLLGEDSFEALGTWYRPDELLALAAPVVAPRPGARAPRVDRYAGVPVRWLEGAPIDLDSTSIREALAAGREPAGLDPLVLGYIREHGLYRKQGE